MRLSQPWPNPYRVNPRGGYGPRIHPITGRQSFHTGIDIAGVFAVTSSGDGVVVHVGWAPKGGGNVVVIDHGFIHTAYFHGAHRTSLKVGDRVRAGDFIYQSGSTGASTGPHLHFETRRNRTQASHVDPTPYLNGNATAPALNASGKWNRETWRQFQAFLKADWGYAGRVDGIQGPLTNKAIQRLATAHGYTGPVDGKLGPNSIRAVQRWLGVSESGRWDSLTVAALQRRLNDGGY